MPVKIKRPLTLLNCVTTEELAKRWHVEVRTIRAMIKAGRIPAKKIETTYIIPADVQYPDRRKLHRAQDKPWGRQPYQRGEDYMECYRLWRDGSMSGTQAGKRLGIACATFLKWAREDKMREATT